ncbi:crosslink repair DNA glycosylase YcaQ family protein [Vibrio cortegadensis]|uniref:winged helix-turn-helix domain-containing protein n=1 Tax=Vibrio cortegadensis TaxID=1328770 RepID=UPI0021C46F47|nr:crosslink repair DNA glycosylase YcaQ family protein [Vibrio cortegadensis]MDN3698013.1 crosslink repair DNA glycosylase YcaQ family protein [Vibrio cortegadensis]
MESLSLDQARKLVLHAQKIPPRKQKVSGLEATLSVIEHLGYIQIDTISVVQRAHHHTLWNRSPRYQPAHLDQLLSDKKVFEYWSHAAAYLPMSQYRFSLLRKKAFASGEQSHWYKCDYQLMDSVRQRIADEGPLMAKDFDGADKSSDGWGSKPAKRALENLFMKGELMVPERRNFHKVYDLTERVLPTEVDTSVPSKEEYARFLILSYIAANGLGTASEMTYLLKNIKPLLNATIKEMTSNGDIIAVDVGKQRYYTTSESLELLNQPLNRSQVKILSPFDNLLIQRKRMKALFEFDYLLECYVPEPKRQYGYFSLPILWDGKLVARMDCKKDKKLSVLNVLHLSIEPSIQKKDQFLSKLSLELTNFAHFNGCKAFKIHRTTS